MAKYEYKAVDRTGKSKHGTIEAGTEEAAKAKLKADGLTITSFGESKDVDLRIGGGKKVKARDLSVFCKQFASVLRAGVPIIAALDMMSQQMDNKTLQAALIEAMTYVQKGGSLSDGLKLNPKVFPPILYNMVAAGESSGKLEICFDRLAVQFEKDSALQGKIKGAMTYPIVVLLVILGVVVVMMVSVIPTFSEMFKEMGADLPIATQILVNISDFLVARWYICLLIVAALVFGIKFFKNTDYGKHFNGSIAMKLPVFGQLNIKTYAASFSRTFATLLASGISMIDAVDQTAKVMKNIIVREKLLKCKDQVAKGVPLSKPIKDMDIFPVMLPQMMHIGEETGNIEDMMNKVADFYEEEVDTMANSLTQLLEPIIIVVMAVIVGVIVVAIYSPIMSMYDAVDNY